MYYAGIGSRKTPKNTLELMAYIAKELSKSWTLRSGHAGGADQAFEYSAAKKEIYIPWHGFNGAGKECIVPKFTQLQVDIAASHHPAWYRCTPVVQRMHMRNVCQVLGEDCVTPSTMVICWTPNGDSSGGTGQAIRIAKSYNIPVFDLALPDTVIKLAEFVYEV